MKTKLILLVLASILLSRAAEISISWDPSSEPDIVGYHVYSWSEGAEVRKVFTTLRHADVPIGWGTNWVEVTAVTSIGLESTPTTLQWVNYNWSAEWVTTAALLAVIVF